MRTPWPLPDTTHINNRITSTMNFIWILEPLSKRQWTSPPQWTYFIKIFKCIIFNLLSYISIIIIIQDWPNPFVVKLHFNYIIKINPTIFIFTIFYISYKYSSKKTTACRIEKIITNSFIYIFVKDIRGIKPLYIMWWQPWGKHLKVDFRIVFSYRRTQI